MRLYEERSWTSNYIEILPGRTHVENEQHRLNRPYVGRYSPQNSNGNGNANANDPLSLYSKMSSKRERRPVKWIAFNLPEGMVVTLTEKQCCGGLAAYSLDGCGLHVDLIGRGETVGVDLEDPSFAQLSTTVSMFSWRWIVLEHGAFELFSRTDYQGERVTIYLSDWRPNKDGAIFKYDLKGWSMNQKARSIRFKAVDSTVRIYLYGTSTKYDLTNLAGWLDDREVPDLYAYGQQSTKLALKIGTAFGWGAVSPIKEVVEPFAIDEQRIAFKLHQTDRCELRNDSSDHGCVSHEFVYTTTITKTLTATTTMSSAIGLEVVAKDPISQSTITVTVTADGSNTKENTITRTEQVEQKRTLTVSAPPHSTRHGRLQVFHCHVKDMKYRVKVRRWYRLKLPDAKQDSTDPTLWQRDESVPITISSSFDGPGFATKSVSILEGEGRDDSWSSQPRSTFCLAILLTVAVVALYMRLLDFIGEANCVWLLPLLQKPT